MRLILQNSETRHSRWALADRKGVLHNDQSIACLGSKGRSRSLHEIRFILIPIPTSDLGKGGIFVRPEAQDILKQLDACTES